MKQFNNKGLTLVELIITMAISSIIIGAIVILMSASSRSYQSGEREIKLQVEAQAVMNQIANLIMEGNNITFNNTLPGSSRLTIYHTDDDTSTFDRMEVIWLDQSERRLYFYLIHNSSEQTAMENEISSKANLSDNLLGEYVENITVDPASLSYIRDGNSTVTIALSMINGDKAYQAEQAVSLRNRIVDLPATTPTPP